MSGIVVFQKHDRDPMVSPVLPTPTKKPPQPVNFADMLSPMTAASFLTLAWAALAYVMIRIGFWPLRESMQYREKNRTPLCVLEIMFAVTTILYVVMFLAGISLLVPDSLATGFVQTCVLILVCLVADRLRAMRSVWRSGTGFPDEEYPFQTTTLTTAQRSR